jgi:hypothetical protein
MGSRGFYDGGKMYVRRDVPPSCASSASPMITSVPAIAGKLAAAFPLSFHSTVNFGRRRPFEPSPSGVGGGGTEAVTEHPAQ